MKFDAVIIGGGQTGSNLANLLQNLGRRCVIVSEGLSLCDDASFGGFLASGGTVLNGDRVIGGTFEGNRLISVRTQKLGDATLEAPVFVLATGKYFSRGIVADMDRVYEPIFGLDVEYDEDRSTWFNPSFSAPQRFLEFGVRTQDGCALKDGQKIINLIPTGEVLAGVSCVGENGAKAVSKSIFDAFAAIKRI